MTSNHRSHSTSKSGAQIEIEAKRKSFPIMNLQRNQQRRAAGVKSTDHLSAREKELMDAWENAPPEFLADCKRLNIDPDIGRKQSGPVNHDHDDKDVFATIATPQSDREFDEPEPEEKSDAKFSAAEAVLRVLYVLAGAKHPSLRLRADCLLAIINRTENRSQAEIARKYGLTRAAISKTMRDMRKGDYLAGLEIFFFGGRKDTSEAARTRAIRVHQETKQQNQSWKPSSQLETFLGEL